MEPKDRIIVALDCDTLEQAGMLVQELAPHVGMFKVGLELISAVGGPAVVNFIHQHGGKVFYDGKFNDIPNTISRASAAVSDLGVQMFNVHAASGIKGMKAAAEKKGMAELLAVTVLTSFDDTESYSVFGDGCAAKVLRFAKDAQQAGCDGIICSPKELLMLGTSPDFADLLKVTPGVRPAGSDADDQKRIMTPAEAIQAGANYLVIGRPITSPMLAVSNPRVVAALKIAEEIASVL